MKGTDILTRAKRQLASTAKIMITWYPSLESGVVALEECADAYLTKSVQPNELLLVSDDKLGIRKSAAPSSSEKCVRLG